MIIEIWSDVVCPFCYIGKRNLEQALKMAPAGEAVEIHFRSFLLDPDLRGKQEGTIFQYLALRKGQSLEWAVQANRQVTQMAAQAGLVFHMEKVVVAGSVDAHRVIQLAETRGQGKEAADHLFRAYFTEGRDISSVETLEEIGMHLGWEAETVEKMLKSGEFSRQVEDDFQMARELGVRGVPFFVFDRKLAVTGAQPPETLVKVLEQARQA